jgi:helicase
MTEILQTTNDPVVNVVLDTLEKNKQALVFVNTKRSAEKVAEDISRKTKIELIELSEKIKTIIATPTKQCERLAKCVKKGIAFHHSGLHTKQRELIEENFKKGVIKIICCTPTLAAGLDLPAFRTIIRDAQRYTSRGMRFIPVLEYLQMAGRAGRPSYDDVGEAILIAKTEAAKNELYDRYICGVPEHIYSKLAVEPVLRTYVLSLIATKFVSTKDELLEFFGKTFWAHQYKDMNKLSLILDRMLLLLTSWGLLQKTGQSSEFVDATEFTSEKFRATFLGKRVAELYLDPLTAHSFVRCLKKASGLQNLKAFSFLQALSNTLEMRPLLRVKVKEWDDVQEKLILLESYIIDTEPSMYEPEYDSFMSSIKTALIFEDWINEIPEHTLLEKYSIRPGETRAKLAVADWLLYCLAEIANILQKNELIKDIKKTRVRLKYGVKEELLPLLTLKQVGRIRARKLFAHNIKTIQDVKKADSTTLTLLVGKKVGAFIKKQVGC